ncbi:MAG: prepilin-type N-terminal cleavage/methylation domain-containing protein [Proteobacteria bacterium]|nr:prepilin-type N-terminal cleavage/methylation domain-containing protein [Pseudomonadota bacterium]
MNSRKKPITNYELRPIHSSRGRGAKGPRGQETRVQGFKGSRVEGKSSKTSHVPRPTNKGFTLIELIIFIIIAGIFLPATYIAFSSAMKQGTQPEDYTRGMLLAEQTMELATKRGYTQLALDIAAPPTCAAIGVSAPAGWNINTTCAWTPSFRSFNGTTFSASVPAAPYIQIVVTVTTPAPQSNTYTSTGMVTNHAF